MASATKDNELRSFDVPEIARHPGGYTIYKIVLSITPKELTENSYQLIYWKRYTDIRKLYDTLHRYHQAIYRPGKFPDFPAKSRYAERFNPTIIEERRLATKQFLNFASQHLYLRTHDAYTTFLQNGEKVLSPDIETDTLKPESAIQETSQVTIPELPTPVPAFSTEEKKDEFLFDVDGDESVEHLHKTSTGILEDLNDLEFEQNQDNKVEVNLIETELEDLVLSSTNINNTS